MRTLQPAGSPLGILLLIALIVLVVKSPKKLQTLGRIGIAFVSTVVIFLLVGAVLRKGDPEAVGEIGGLVALLAAVIAGWWHIRSLKRSGAGTSGQPPVKP